MNEIINASWAKGTQKSYNNYLQKWKSYCKERQIRDPYEVEDEVAMEFLVHLFNDEGRSYGYVAAARSAMSAVLPKRKGKSFGQNDNVSRLLKGMFKMRPSLPKHTVIYDPDIVISYMQKLPDNKNLELELLTKKLATLLCLLSGQRAQTIGALSLNHHHGTKEQHVFYIPKILKTTRPNNHQEPLCFLKFPEDERICVVNCLETYIQRTENIRENLEDQPQQLLLSYAYPHQPIGVCTIARYIKLFLGMAGIDITVFTAHSTRSASTSKANNIGLTIKDICRAAGWRSDSCFQKYYKLPIIKNFGEHLLKR